MNRAIAEAVEASSSSKKKGREGKKPLHVCGEINGVNGKGAFSKEGDRFRCIECGKLLEKLPESYMPALKKISPKRTRQKPCQKPSEPSPPHAYYWPSGWACTLCPTNSSSNHPNNCTKHIN